MIFIPMSFIFPTNFLYRNFFCFLSFFESQVFLNVFRIAKCDALIWTLFHMNNKVVKILPDYFD